MDQRIRFWINRLTQIRHGYGKPRAEAGNVAAVKVYMKRAEGNQQAGDTSSTRQAEDLSRNQSLSVST